ncbi:MAG TPA: hypothetical protein VGM05_21995, partial [Planctomycetaceae bacterium]
RPFSILRQGIEHHFIAVIEFTDTGAAAVAEGVDGRPLRGLFTCGDNVAHAIKQLQGALILHLDGCEAEGIDPWENNPEIGD